ncbi:MAG: CPBP family intramembrane metalloprotease [Ruminococcus sp.]|nr:CPBP family intramembrane metalloprotease [Ruminococcus sp.]
MTDIKERKLNPYDPFDNPTENCAYRTDYRMIEPAIGQPGYELPLLPEKAERKRIRSCFNTVGAGLLLGAVFVNVAFYLIFMVLEIIMAGGGDFSALMDVENYINYRSSIMMGLNGLLFLIANAVPAVVGCHITGIRVRTLFRPLDVKKSCIVRYMTIGIFIQAITGILYTLLNSLMEAGGIQDYTPEIDTFFSAKSIVVSGLYTCLIAPVTEELLYRGFVLKNLSRVSQRFGIIISAVLFGLAHENIAQFVLAVPAGIFMARIAVKHNSLIPSILVHMAVNTLAFIMEWVYATLPMTGTGIALSYALDAVYYFIAAAGLVFWISELRKNRLPANTIRQSYRGARIALTSPCLVAICVFHGVMALLVIVSQNLMA